MTIANCLTYDKATSKCTTFKDGYVISEDGQCSKCFPANCKASAADYVVCT